MPNLLARIGARIKAAGTALAFPGGYYPGLDASRDLARRGTFVPVDAAGRVLNIGMGDPDESRAGPAWENSCVAIGLDWITSNFPQADLVVEESHGKGWERADDHPMVALLDDPAPDHGAYDFHGLWSGALLSCLCDGNGYWLKVRDGSGAVVELWWIPHPFIEPVRTSPTAPDYRYRYCVPIPDRPDFVKYFDPEDIVHFKWGVPDPANDLKAVAPLRRCVQQLIADNEVGRYTSAILFNHGVAGLVVVYEEDGPETEAEADAVKAALERRTTGRNRGRAAVLKGKVRLEQVAFSPDKLALNEITRIPEARICGALRMPAMVLGLAVGDNQKTYRNLGEAESQAWRNGIRPLQGRMAEALYRQLLPDFEPDRKSYRVAWDYSRVEALQEDRDATAKRSVLLYQGGVAMRGEARAMVGMAPADDGSDDIYWVSGNPHEGAVLGGEGEGAALPPRIAKEMTHADVPGGGVDGIRPGLLHRVPDSPQQPEDGALDALAYRVLKQFEAATPSTAHATDDPGGRPGRPQILDARGRPLGATGQPPWPADWAADRTPDGDDVPPDGAGDPDLAGEPGERDDDEPVPGGDDPDVAAQPDASREAAGEVPGEADPAVPDGGGDGDAGEPGIGGDDEGRDVAGPGLDAGPPGE